MSQVVAFVDLHNDRGQAPSFTWQVWLESALAALRAKFNIAGYQVPPKTRISIGWPKRAGSCGAIGECWATEFSSDQHAEIFVSPEVTNGVQIVETLAHELIHATVGIKAGHGPPFNQCATRIGLAGPMRATTASPEFVAWLEKLFACIGPYPSGYLVDTPKQGTRQLKCQCPVCGYTARVARKWLSTAGPPLCPSDRIPMPETASSVEPGGAP